MALETIRLQGLEGVMATLRQLPPEVVSRRGGPVRAALRKGALVIQRQEIANLQQVIAQPNQDGLPDNSTGLLEKNIVVTRGRPPQGVNGERYLVRIRSKRYPNATGTKPVTTSQVARWFEYGTEDRAQQPFIRPAFEAKKVEAAETVVSELNKSLARIQKKLERQNRVKT